MKRFLVSTGAILMLAGVAACDPAFRAGGTVSGSPASPVAQPPTPLPSALPAEPTGTPHAEPPSEAPTQNPAPKPTSKCKEGTQQLEVETAIAAMGGFGTLNVDGKQSDGDCDVIKKFQKRFGLWPVDGIPGPATNRVAQRLVASDPGQCAAGPELTACIDLTNQTTWLMENGKVVYGPTVARTGYDHPDGKGAPTPSGSYNIIERQRSNWTESFEVYLHYWQRIMGNNGFHETTTYIHDMSLGSHGCVNLLRKDAIAYWEKIDVGTPIEVFGRRPGT